MTNTQTTDLTQRAKDRIAVVRQWRGNKDADAAIMDHLLSEVIALRAHIVNLQTTWLLGDLQASDFENALQRKEGDE